MWNEKTLNKGLKQFMINCFPRQSVETLHRNSKTEVTVISCVGFKVKEDWEKHQSIRKLWAISKHYTIPVITPPRERLGRITLEERKTAIAPSLWKCRNNKYMDS